MKKAAVPSILIAAILFAVATLAEAQPTKVPKIGWLGTCTAPSNSRFEEFRRALRDLGYAEGKNIIFEYRSADNKLDRLPPLAEELVRLKVDLLLAWNP